MPNEVETIELPVFRADHAASKGITAAMLADVADFDCDSNPVPNIYGHAEGHKPAMDRVRAFRVAGDTLFAAVPKATKAAARIWEGIKDGSILNRSMAFFAPDDPQNPTPGKLAPRHLGWLGANAPRIPGLPALHKVAAGLSFEGDELVIGDPEPAFMFEATAPIAPTAVVTAPRQAGEKKEFEAVTDKVETPEEKKLREDREQLAADRLAFEASVKASRNATSAASIDALVAAGKVLPAEVAGLKLVFEAIAPEALEFEAGKDKLDPAAHLSAFLATALPKRVDVDGGRQTPAIEFEGEKLETGEDVEAAARALMDKNKGLTFEAAVAKVTGQE